MISDHPDDYIRIAILKCIGSGMGGLVAKFCSVQESHGALKSKHNGPEVHNHTLKKILEITILRWPRITQFI